MLAVIRSMSRTATRVRVVAPAAQRAEASANPTPIQWFAVSACRCRLHFERAARQRHQDDPGDHQSRADDGARP